jgi:hypothetical protein
LSYLKAKDTVSGQEARAYMVIDGETEEMFFAKKLVATVTKEKTEVRTLGKRGVQYKAKGWKGTGNMIIYYATSRFREILLQYMEQGQDVYFDIQVINEDAGTELGRQTVVLKNVNLDSMTVAAFDASADVLEESVNFTFEGMELLDRFEMPTLGMS